MSAKPNFVKLDLPLIVHTLNERRKAGQGVTLAKYLKDELDATPGELYQHLGLDPEKHSFGDLWAGPEHLRWIAPEFIRDCVIEGMRRKAYEDYVIGATQTSQSKIQDFPYLDMSEMAAKPATRRTPGASFQQYPFAVREKFVNTQEFGAGMLFPYTFNNLARVKLNVLPVFFMAFGIQLGRQIWQKTLQALLVGDGGVLSIDNKEAVDQTPITIGVKDKLKGIQEADFIGVLIEMEIAGKAATSMIADGVTCQAALNWNIFDAEKYPATDIKATLVTPLPQNVSIIPSNDLGGKMIILNREMALVKFVYRNLVVEADKIISKQLEEAYASCDHGVANLLRGARVVVDPTLDFNQSQYASWFYMT